MNQISYALCKEVFDMRKQWISRLVAFVMAMVLCLSVAAAALAAYDTIPYGEQSTAVRQMQDKLKAKGYYRGAVDGHFGPATKAAVIKFQKDVGITPDGRPGNVTLTALYSGKTAVNQATNGERNYTTNPTNPHTLYYGCTGYRVKKLQSALRAAGVYKGNIDGIYGDLTYNAVRKYQRQKGLDVDGMAGTRPLASLKKHTNINVGSSFLLAKGSKGREVADMMNYLRSKGYTSESGELYTAQFAEDVKAWQTATGKKVTGTITEAQYNNIVLGKEK